MARKGASRTRAVLCGTALLALLGAAVPDGASACAGDCDGDGRVTVDELVLCVDIAVGDRGADVCAAADPNHDGVALIPEVMRAVANALRGCPPVIDQCFIEGLPSGCPPGTFCGCCCGVYRCLAPGAVCCLILCPL